MILGIPDGHLREDLEYYFKIISLTLVPTLNP